MINTPAPGFYWLKGKVLVIENFLEFCLMPAHIQRTECQDKKPLKSEKKWTVQQALFEDEGKVYPL